MNGLAVVAAFAIDAAFGEPPNALHPVAWMGSLIARGRAWALRGDKAAQLLKGAVVALVVPALSAALAYALIRGVAPYRVAAVVVTALALKSTFAVRALREAAFRVRDRLDGGNLPGARVALQSLCSRDASCLDERALVAATVESVAENTSDSVVAPLFYFACLGVPGAAFYRAANTIDAMMGYHGELEWAGKVGARLDDVLCFVPARLTALLFVVAGALTGGDVRRGVTVWRRDAARTESPNAGRPMATMAGLLGVRLDKPGHYALGDDTRPLATVDITRAWRIAWIASTLSAGLAAVGAITVTLIIGRVA
jgi:adenosylcobinamide-phosphate synthase